MRHTRRRYQRGSLTLEKRGTGPVWCYRWRESSADGHTIQRKRIIGSKKEFPTETAARKAVEGLCLDINAEVSTKALLTVGELISHYKEAELADGSSKTPLTKSVYRHHLDKFIAPRWGASLLRDVRPIEIEKWLAGLPGAASTKSKTKSVMGTLFQHALRYEWATTNPIRLVRQSAKAEKEQIVLEPVEISALLSELAEPFRTLVLLAAVTGLRRGELFGLRWQDINFRDAEIHVRRSVVDQVEGPPKTLGSKRPIPMSLELATALEGWRKQTSYSMPADWVFASPRALGKKPYWPDAVLKRHILPAAERAGITKRVGWHSFRRTLATLLVSSGASVKTAQELLRHASPTMTLGTYAKAVTADKRRAQDTIAALFVGDSETATEARL